MPFFDPRTSVAEEREIKTSITGTGENNPTLTAGKGQRLTVTRAAVGVYRYAFADPKQFVIAIAQLRADNPASLNRFTVVGDTFTVANGTGTIDFAIFNAAGAPASLTALQYMDVTFTFSDSTAGLA